MDMCLRVVSIYYIINPLVGRTVGLLGFSSEHSIVQTQSFRFSIKRAFRFKHRLQRGLCAEKIRPVSCWTCHEWKVDYWHALRQHWQFWNIESSHFRAKEFHFLNTDTEGHKWFEKVGLPRRSASLQRMTVIGWAVRKKWTKNRSKYFQIICRIYILQNIRCLSSFIAWCKNN